MIQVDIPMPRKCYDCPMSYWIMTGPNEGRLMCEAIEFRDNVDAGACLVDEHKRNRPVNCPIMKGEEVTI